ncbi:MAG: ABC transporter ATP-binding protein [Candidatus Nezhaarchaeota archaeon]|nr:ABC transporter ATP-binding protein [Candidatus Nezhaarchaeota archaeon]
MLSVKKLSVSYGSIRVLWDVSMDVREGEIVSLIGVNGSGKTTTIRTISGLLKPLSGEIEFNGVKITRMPPHKRVEMGMAHVPEGRRIFAGLTVLENLYLGAYLKKAREKFQETLEWVYQLFPRLKERQNQVAGSLSGGEQQMLAIGRALMTRPRLLMLDEPSLGLAPTVVKSLMKTIEDLNKEGVTVLLVEQNVYYSLKISHRAYVLEKGSVVMSDRGENLLNNPVVKSSYLGVG